MASIHFKLSLADMAGYSTLEINLSKTTDLSVVLNDSNISLKDIGVVIKNGIWINAEKCLIQNNDQVILFPNIQGG